jgi:hypothetical protein
MKIIGRIVSSVALCVFLVSSASAQKKKEAKSTPFLTEGTFSNIAVGSGGDYGGMQIHLTDSDGQFYALVTIAEGVLAPPVLVKAKADIKARKIDFVLPGKPGRKFTAIIGAGGMTLVEVTTMKTSDGLSLDENDEQFLKRICQK